MKHRPCVLMVRETGFQFQSSIELFSDYPELRESCEFDAETLLASKKKILEGFKTISSSGRLQIPQTEDYLCSLLQDMKQFNLTDFKLENFSSLLPPTTQTDIAIVEIVGNILQFQSIAESINCVNEAKKIK